jgi:tRNA(Ile)-lysidine synthase
MPRRRGRILRPLLDLSRADVLRYLAQRQIPYRTDSTNADPQYLRNRIRLKLIPLLDTWFPRWRTSLLALAETQGLAADFLEAEAAERIPWHPVGPDSVPPGMTVGGDLFFAQAPIIREEALFLAADRLAGQRRGGEAPDGPGKPPGGPRRRSVRLFAGGGFRAMDLGATRIEADGDLLRLSVPEDGGGQGFSLLIKEPGRYKLEGLTIESRFPEPGQRVEGEGFFAGLPLVFRPSSPHDPILQGGVSRALSKVLARTRGSGYTGIVTAEDRRGIAAFIGLGRGEAVLLARREEDAGDTEAGSSFFTFAAEASPAHTGV